MECAEARLKWLEHRKKGIGASDCPAIMGVSPYNTAMDVYLDKTSDQIVEKTNYIMELGNTLEPIARAHYEILNDADFPPANFVNATKPHYRCSLDGYNSTLNKAIEIKYCGKSFTETCPDKYYPQIQYQYAVTGAASVDLVQIDNMNRINVIRVDRDDKYIEDLLLIVDWFWSCIVERSEQKVQVFSDNVHITINQKTYRISNRHIKKCLKLLSGKEYKMHRFHQGDVLSYLEFIELFGKKKK